MSSIIFFLIFIPILSIVLLSVNFIFAPHNPYKEKKTPFECGYHSFLSQNRTQFTISFFIFALLFLIFDLEIVLIYPFSVSSYANNIYGLVIMIIFTLIVTVGFIFELGKNALKIESKQSQYTDSVIGKNKKFNNSLKGLESSLFNLSSFYISKFRYYFFNSKVQNFFIMFLAAFCLRKIFVNGLLALDQLILLSIFSALVSIPLKVLYLILQDEKVEFKLSTFIFPFMLGLIIPLLFYGLDLKGLLLGLGCSLLTTVIELFSLIGKLLKMTSYKQDNVMLQSGSGLLSKPNTKSLIPISFKMESEESVSRGDKGKAPWHADIAESTGSDVAKPVSPTTEGSDKSIGKKLSSLAKDTLLGKLMHPISGSVASSSAISQIAPQQDNEGLLVTAQSEIPLKESLIEIEKLTVLNNIYNEMVNNPSSGKTRVTINRFLDDESKVNLVIDIINKYPDSTAAKQLKLGLNSVLNTSLLRKLLLDEYKTRYSDLSKSYDIPEFTKEKMNLASDSFDPSQPLKLLRAALNTLKNGSAKKTLTGLIKDEETRDLIDTLRKSDPESEFAKGPLSGIANNNKFKTFIELRIEHFKSMLESSILDAGVESSSEKRKAEFDLGNSSKIAKTIQKELPLKDKFKES